MDSTKKSLIFVLIPLVLFLFITALVCLCNTITNIDIEIIKQFQHIFSFLNIETVHQFSNILYHYGSVVIFVLILFFVHKKNFSMAIIFLACNTICYDFIKLIKGIIQRTRPPFELQLFTHPKDFSFPSGHTFDATIFFGLLIYIISKYVKNNITKYTLCSICVIMIMLVGLSRILLGVHYPTDVLAGFLLGLTIVFAVSIIDRY